MRETSIRSAVIPRPVLAAIAAVVSVLIVAVLALWVHFGTAVFYDAIVAGIAACL
ncbi:MAG: hypothetical protein ACXWJW_12280 [Xanthobacteraceae bacterium]